MDSNDYKMIMHFFPPVNNTIENPHMEAVQSYNMYKATSPLKPPEKDLMYSEQIMYDLRMLRILLFDARFQHQEQDWSREIV